jgi:hypothetical protein
MDNILVTMDIDWAPEEAVEYCVDLLKKHGIKTTLFATHESAVLKELVNDDDIEIGIHPNYFKNKNFESAVDELLDIYPESVSVKAHGLYSSSNIVKLYEKKGLKTCSDVFLPGHPNLRPVWRFGNDSILMIPYLWEDDNYFNNVSDPDFEIDSFISIPGLKIFNFHPVHVFANTSSPEHYQDFKEYYKQPAELKKRRAEKGTTDFFIKLINHISKDNKTMTLEKLYKLEKSGAE